MTRTDRHPIAADGRSLDDLLSAGCYDHVNRYLHPLSGGPAPADFAALVCLERVATTAEVSTELDRLALEPGRLPELLALGAARPELQRAFPIVALGAAEAYPSGYRRLPFLWGSPHVRHLDLRWDEGRWAANVRFLATDAGLGQAAEPGSPAAISTLASSTRPYRFQSSTPRGRRASST